MDVINFALHLNLPLNKNVVELYYFLFSHYTKEKHHKEKKLENTMV